jgi:hypothetical protein
MLPRRAEFALERLQLTLQLLDVPLDRMNRPITPSRARRALTPVEVLDRREVRAGLVIVIAADIEMQPSGQKDRIMAVGALNAETGRPGLQRMGPSADRGCCGRQRRAEARLGLHLHL